MVGRVVTLDFASPPRMDCWVVGYSSCFGGERHCFLSEPVDDVRWLLIPASGRLAIADRRPIESGFSEALVSEASAVSINIIMRGILAEIRFDCGLVRVV